MVQATDVQDIRHQIEWNAHGCSHKEWHCYYSREGTCMKDPWTMTMGGTECGRWVVGRPGDSNVGKMRTTAIDQQ